MLRKKESAPQPASNRDALNNKRRLSQEEWDALWLRDGWMLVAMFGILFASMAGVL